MKVKILPVGATGKKKIAVAAKQTRADIGLTEKNDCICATMAPHCPIHAAVRTSPAIGQDVIR